MEKRGTNVAVLLATYNGARFVEQQIGSLRKNDTYFTLHWLDDHSNDDSRKIVRAVAFDLGIPLREWHTPTHQGIPSAFFELLEHVEADIYCFCDQDDIWQPGKIDATVENLISDVKSPVLCFSDPFIFKSEEPDSLYRLSYITGATPELALQESRLFMAGVAYGHTQGFTRPLREMFIKHKNIARAYAMMHDEWIHNIAAASGLVRIINNVPTTCYRWHGGNATEEFGSWNGKSNTGGTVMSWRQHRIFRMSVSRHAEGFLLASKTLPPSRTLERSIEVARLVATLNKRHSLAEITNLARNGIMWPNRRLAVRLAISCLCSEVSRSAP